MIVISSSLPKSGSAWLYNMTNDLLVAAGFDDAREIRDRYRLDFLVGPNCRLTHLNPINYLKLIRTHLRGHTFAIKTHRPLDLRMRFLIHMSFARATFIYRDPRDVLLSGLDHGEKLRKVGKDHSFASWVDFEIGIEKVTELLHYALHWHEHPRVLPLRYEDLVTDPIAQLRLISGYLRISCSIEQIERIVGSYQRPEPDATSPMGQCPLHFNVGRVGRFRQEFDNHQQSLCNSRFRSYMSAFGYSE